MKSQRMWVVWVMFFFQYAAVGIYFTYLNVYFRQAGLNGTQIGLLNMVTALVGVGSAVVWGYLSDRTGKPHLMIALGAVGAVAAAQVIPYVNGFWPFLLLGSLGSMMGSAPSTLVDSTTLVLLGERREEYGRFRMGGSIGYIITTFSSGFFLQASGLRWIFPIYGVIMLIFALVVMMMPRVSPRTEAHASGSGGIGKMMASPAWLLFITVIFLVWITAYAAIMFLGVSLSSMGASQSLIGIVATVPAIFEIPVMYFSASLLRRFGPVRLLTIGIGMNVVRFFLFGIMPVPAWAIAINAINGPAYAFYWNSAVTYANKMAPRGLEGTAQGMLASTMSLAGVVSSLLSGWLFDLLGPTGIFLVMSGLLFVAMVLFTVGNRMQRSREEASPA